MYVSAKQWWFETSLSEKWSNGKLCKLQTFQTSQVWAFVVCEVTFCLLIKLKFHFFSNSKFQLESSATLFWCSSTRGNIFFLCFFLCVCVARRFPCPINTSTKMSVPELWSARSRRQIPTRQTLTHTLFSTASQESSNCGEAHWSSTSLQTMSQRRDRKFSLAIIIVMGAVCITSLNPMFNGISFEREYSDSIKQRVKGGEEDMFNGSRFGLPTSSILKMTGLGGKMVWTMMYWHRPHCDKLKTVLPACS